MARKPDPVATLDFYRGFEAAARHLSFTRAAAELFVTQSAISRQIQSLEQRLGVPLFTRRNRGLALTEAGLQMYRAADIALRTLREAAQRIAPDDARNMVTVTATMAFCSLWLIPRLASFREAHPEVDVRISAENAVLDLDREHIDVAVRYCPVPAAPPGAVRMFGEQILPICSPRLLKDRSRPLKAPADLKHHTLLHYDPGEVTIPWLSWDVWLETAGVPGLKPAGVLRFSQYDQVVAAAVGGQGVGIGRLPLVGSLIADGSLASPFRSDRVTDRAHFIVRSAASRGRRDVEDFVAWLVDESARLERAMGKDPARGRSRAKAG
ncbi:MAG TPA: LysR substrate-binding domain-containing protein [Burkholderiales bacterium]|nr:LysR substrate-binding domain-containing protein [Burkholderiales bacterium]